MENLELLEQSQQLTKSMNESIIQLADRIDNMFKEGLVSGKDTLKLFAGVKFLKDKMEAITKDDKIKGIVLEEFDKFGEKKVEFDTFSISKRAYGKYDYSEINHPIIDVQNYINNVLETSVTDAKNVAKLLLQNMNRSVVLNDVIALKKETVITLQEQIDVAFSTLLDLFEDGQEVINLTIKPAKLIGGDSIVVTQKKVK